MGSGDPTLGWEEKVRSVGGQQDDRVDDVDDAVGGHHVGRHDLGGVVEEDGAILTVIAIREPSTESADVSPTTWSAVTSPDDVVEEDLLQGLGIGQGAVERALRRRCERLVGRCEDREGALTTEGLDEAGRGGGSGREVLKEPASVAVATMSLPAVASLGAGVAASLGAGVAAAVGSGVAAAEARRRRWGGACRHRQPRAPAQGG